MKDLVYKQEGQFYGKRAKSNAKPLPVTRVHRLTANKYSARFMETLGSADVMSAINQHKEAINGRVNERSLHAEAEQPAVAGQ